MWMILKLFGIWFCRLRASLFIFTGDHPAQSKVSNFKNSGYSSCRRCHTTHAVNAEGKVVFSEEHTTMDLVESLDNWEAASTKREKKLISNASG
jgi:hypothetical protein